jgi:hypothetical protein
MPQVAPVKVSRLMAAQYAKSPLASTPLRTMHNNTLIIPIERTQSPGPRSGACTSASSSTRSEIHPRFIENPCLQIVLYGNSRRTKPFTFLGFHQFVTFNSFLSFRLLPIACDMAVLIVSLVLLLLRVQLVTAQFPPSPGNVQRLASKFGNGVSITYKEVRYLKDLHC